MSVRVSCLSVSGSGFVKRSSSRRSLALRSLALAAVLAMPGVAMAFDPQTPTDVVAIPTYTAARPITISWTNNEPLATGFTIQRSVDGGPFATIATLLTPDTSYVDASDKSGSLNSKYTYQVITDTALASSTPFTGVETPISVTWPLADGSRKIMQGFGDGSVNSFLAYHEGLDIFASGTQKTVAMRGGTVVNSGGVGTAGQVIVKVDIGGGKFEFDTYEHIGDRKVAVGDVVQEGKIIAESIASFNAANTNSDHLHLSVARQDYSGLDLVGFEKTWLNPLARFTKAADRDPLQQKPFLFDSNGDGKKFIITPAGKTIPQAAGYEDKTKKPVKGGISMIADVQDNMNSGFNHSATPLSVGYWIEAEFDQGVDKHDVRSAASPYVLSTFDDNWFNDQAWSNKTFSVVYADEATNGQAGLVPTDAGFTSGFRIPTGAAPKNNTVFPFVNNFAVTNTKGGDGKVANVDKDQFWKSDAKESAATTDIDNKANGVTFGTATKNAEARFRDGDYTVHILAKDLVHDYEDLVPGKVRIDNFVQTAFATTEGADALPYFPRPALYDTNNTTTLLTEFLPETADTSPTFGLFDIVAMFGGEYYPDLELSAYLLPHKAEWLNGQSLTDGLIAAVNVQSDADGFIKVYNIWQADREGLFDIIFDYDRDLKFSSTLDGLGGLRVIPEPGALVVLLVPVALASRRRRV